MVEWKKLGEVCEIKTGKGITQKDCSEEYSYPVMSGGQSPMGMYFEFNREANTTTISRVGAYAGFVSFIKEKFYCNDKCFSVIPLKNDVFNSKFLYVVLKHKEESIKKLQSEGGVPTINTKKVGSIFIPIPSLEEQTRIVGILDTFTSAIDNLKEQIAQRRKQYEHYRDQLLDLEGKEGVEMKTLGDIMQIVRGASPRPIKNFITTREDGVNWIKIGDVAPGAKYITCCNEKITKDGAEKSRFLHVGDFILSNSMSFGRPYILKIDGCIHDGWIAMSDFGKYVLPDFLYEYLNSDVVQKYWIMKANNGGAMTNLNSDIVKETPIRIPSFLEQQRIVSILDTFEASIQNLEAQLKQREKQYEYYRNKLLTFE